MLKWFIFVALSTISVSIAACAPDENDEILTLEDIEASVEKEKNSDLNEEEVNDNVVIDSVMEEKVDVVAEEILSHRQYYKQFKDDQSDRFAEFDDDERFLADEIGQIEVMEEDGVEHVYHSYQMDIVRDGKVFIHLMTHEYVEKEGSFELINTTTNIEIHSIESGEQLELIDSDTGKVIDEANFTNDQVSKKYRGIHSGDQY
ncbi:hypothetical protein [Geomicrobium sediminis]|uniref:Lipoprotein n=1 Tax=Geomicrobium sediminis TaxID=1347788 RepID=A0ABS2P7Q2_9BACL|nr:hypothetical protein [Geomicrobium sediminis]MBM7631391.1 hypothetical protein [Geomicrobium sediminis]